MNQVALMVSVEFDPAHRDDVLRALLSHRERCLRDEPGTCQFDVLMPVGEPRKLMVFEVYADDAAMLAHSQGPSIAQYRAEARAKICNVTSQRWHVGDGDTGLCVT